jgi:hypothetical protein
MILKIMKDIEINNKQINPDKIIKDDELLKLKGEGYPSYKCYLEGYGAGCMNFISYINTSSCDNAQIICQEVYNGYCVEGWDC